MNVQEGMIGMGLVSTVQTVLMQCSPKIFQVGYLFFGYENGSLQNRCIL